MNEVRHPVVELRQYTLHRGGRDVLVDLFDREFVESQEAAGMAVVGQFHDLADPDRFVWLRGFPDMPRRAAALHEFYGGPVDPAFTDLFHQRIRPLLAETGAAPVACLSTEYAENTFPDLPVHTGEHVVCWLTRFTDAGQFDDHLRRLDGSARWRDEVLPALSAALSSPPRQLRLAPTARSALC
ncbi:NIPSNAP family protein [Plantactinospora sp. B6F1]|uniref:NIPSNAP family protein n=1 Tax=Plantactinospora sp. B6F1 TaxID=3158971 RepID=UPI0032D982DB